MPETGDTTEALRGHVRAHRSPLVKIGLIAAGSSCLAFAVAGVVLPLLPTTPFLLLAAACYAHSSEGFYVWLLTNRFFGPYIRDWRENKGIPLATKISVIAAMLATMAVTAVFFIPLLPVRVLLLTIGVCVSVYIWRQPTKVLTGDST